MAESVRDILLGVIDDYSRMGPSYMQTRPIMAEVARRLRGKITGDSAEQAVLAAWHDLFRSGMLAWGWDLANPEPPWCHLTDRGRETLKRLSRDPSNPDGYMAYLDAGSLDDIARSYVAEALATYNAGCSRATAVMIGCAAERLMLRVAMHLQQRLGEQGRQVPKALGDWRAKVVRDAIAMTLAPHTASMGKPLSESFSAYWPAFAEQIRGARNDAGHPASVDPVTPETVHAALLIFPELARLANAMEAWIQTHTF